MRLFIKNLLILCLCLSGSLMAQSYNQPIDLALLDYDNTIEPTKGKLSLRSAEHFHALFKRGVDIAVVTMQHRSRIESCLVSPLIDYLKEQKADFSLLTQLHIFSSGGQEYYQVDRSGLKGPIYKIGLSNEKRQSISKLAKAKTNCLGVSDRNTFLSLNYKSMADLQAAQKLFTQDPGLEAIHARYPKEPKYGHFLHLRSPGFSKSYARDYILENIKPMLEHKKNRQVKPEHILVAGDKMGVLDGENDDMGLFIPGAINLALGKEADDRCDPIYLGQYQKGLARWLENHRYSQHHEADQCPTLHPHALAGIHKLATQVIDGTQEDDMVIFLGQTPAYLYPLVAAHRQAKLIAISRTKPEKTIDPTPEQLDHFCHYLESEGLSPEVLRSHKLVLIDHSYHGNAIKAITKTFNSCAKASKPVVFRFINIASDQQIAGNEIASLDGYEFIHQEKLLTCDYLTMRAIAKKDILPRLVSDYPCEDWLSPPHSIDNEETRACIAKVKKFSPNF